MKDLDKIRAQIDWIDKNIMEHLDTRFELMKKIKEVKEKNELEIYDQSREETIMHYIEVNTKYAQEIKVIYEKIIESSKELQHE